MNNNKKLMGVTYTPLELADFVSSRIYKHIESKRKLRVLDPACGDGELLLSIQNKLRNEFDIELNGFDIDQEAILEIKKRFTDNKKISLNFFQKDFINELVKFKYPLLNQEIHRNKYDVIICNPPYVRTQHMDKNTITKISKLFKFTGRLDLYHVFSAGLKYFLKTNGVIGLIISNRFMSVKSGEFLRNYFLNELSIEEIYDFGDTKLFKDSVLPSVLILKNKKIKNTKPVFKSIYEIKEKIKSKKIEKCSNITKSLEKSSDCLLSINDKFYSVRVGCLEILNKKDTWNITNNKTKSFFENVNNNTHCHFGDISKSKVGVKTTADNVFLVNDEQIKKFNIEKKLIKNLIIHKNVDKWKCNNKIYKKILYPYETHNNLRRVLDLDKYVNAKEYFRSHYDQLNSRSYISKSNKKWYEIWVPHHPDEWKKEKIIFRDISEEGRFSLSEDNNVVNGDCYWIKIEKKHEKFKWLILAIGNSKFIINYYDYKFSNKLYSNKRRFISQYVDQFPLPDPNNKFSIEIVKLAKQIYTNYEKMSSEDLKLLESKINDLVYHVFQLK